MKNSTTTFSSTKNAVFSLALATTLFTHVAQKQSHVDKVAPTKQNNKANFSHTIENHNLDPLEEEAVIQNFIHSTKSHYRHSYLSEHMFTDFIFQNQHYSRVYYTITPLLTPSNDHMYGKYLFSLQLEQKRKIDFLVHLPIDVD